MDYKGKVVEVKQGEYSPQVTIQYQDGETRRHYTYRDFHAQVGEEIEFNLKPRQTDRGTYYNISASRSLGGSQAPQAPRPPTQAQRPQTTQSAPTTPRNGSDSRMIFLTGVIGRAMGSGAFKPDDLPALTLAALNAWELLQHPPQAKTIATERPPAPEIAPPGGQPFNDPLPDDMIPD